MGDVQAGLVSGYRTVPGRRHSRNLPFTGINTLLSELTTKHVGLLRELLPNARTISVLASSHAAFEQLQGDARQAAFGQVQSDARAAAAALGLQLFVLNAATESEIEAAFAEVNQQRVDAIAVATFPF